jgi:hypothetical protein
MTRRGIRFALVAALFVVFAPGTTIAQTGTIVDWGPDSYARESSYNAAAYFSNVGSSLQVLGIVNDFAGVMAPLEPVPAGTEYTYVLQNLVSAGTVITPGIYANTYRTVYNTTNPQLDNFFLYRDTGTPADFANPASFVDGTLALSGRFQSITVTFTRRNSDQVVLGGNADTGNPSAANGVFTGGTELFRVSVNGAGCPFRVTGGWAAAVTVPAGYTAHFDGNLDIDCPTPATSATWGRIKGQYR